MCDPLGAVGLALELIKGAYKTYTTYKLTESFGKDFRCLQRQFELQMLTLRGESYRLRQGAVLGVVNDLANPEAWSDHIRKVLVDIKGNTETCRDLAKKYLKDAQDTSFKDDPPISPATTNSVVQVSSDANSTSPSTGPRNSLTTTISNAATGTTTPSSAGTSPVIAEPGKSKSRRFFSFSRRKSAPEKLKDQLRPKNHGLAIHTEHNKSNTSVQYSIPSILNHPAVAQQAECENIQSSILQRKMRLKAKWEWVTADKQTYLDSLNSITSGVEQLRSLITLCFVQFAPNAACPPAPRRPEAKATLNIPGLSGQRSSPFAPPRPESFSSTDTIDLSPPDSSETHPLNSAPDPKSRIPPAPNIFKSSPPKPFIPSPIPDRAPGSSHPPPLDPSPPESYRPDGPNPFWPDEKSPWAPGQNEPYMPTPPNTNPVLPPPSYNPFAPGPPNPPPYGQPNPFEQPRFPRRRRPQRNDVENMYQVPSPSSPHVLPQISPVPQWGPFPHSPTFPQQSASPSPYQTMLFDDNTPSLELLEQPRYSCQEAFHQLCLDLRTKLGPSGLQLDVLSVQLYYGHQHTWQQFRQYPELKLRSNSIPFLFQARLLDSSDKAILLVVDTPAPVTPRGRRCVSWKSSTSDHRLQLGNVLDRVDLDNLGIETAPQSRFAAVGSVMVDSENGGSSQRNDDRAVKTAQKGNRNRSGPNQDDEAVHKGPKTDEQHSSSTPPGGLVFSHGKSVVHNIYWDHSCHWKRSSTLEDLLKDGSFRHQRYAHVHTQLALLLASNFIDLGREGYAHSFRPSDCLYFLPVDDNKVVDHAELVLAPFLQMKIKPTRGIGLAQGISFGRSRALLELGLVLYQVGSWQYLQYSHPHGFDGLVKEAISNLYTVSNHAGPALASIVHYCLADHQDLPGPNLRMRIPADQLKEWPRYGYLTDYEYFKTLENTGNPPVCATEWLKRRPGNEVVEILNFVVNPLHKSLYGGSEILQDSHSTRFHLPNPDVPTMTAFANSTMNRTAAHRRVDSSPSPCRPRLRRRASYTSRRHPTNLPHAPQPPSRSPSTSSKSEDDFGWRYINDPPPDVLNRNRQSAANQPYCESDLSSVVADDGFSEPHVEEGVQSEKQTQETNRDASETREDAHSVKSLVIEGD